MVADGVGPARLLEVNSLAIGYQRDGMNHTVLHGASFTLYQAEVVAVVGESGSGKSTLLAGLLGLLPDNGFIAGGEVRWKDGQNLLDNAGRGMNRFRRDHMGFVPQNPMTSLNPVRRIGSQFSDVNIEAGSSGQRNAEMINLLEQAGLKESAAILQKYPHELSGGMQQRVLIAMALAGCPELIIADEPTSALDVTVQKQILDHLQMLAHERRISLLLVTHDIALASERASRIIVMQNGHIVEQGPSELLISRPAHEYTRRLVATAPSFRGAFRYYAAPTPVGMSSEFPVLIETKGVSRSYTSGGTMTNALCDANIILRRGRTTALVGESGSGKTTLARVILGLVKPTSGTVLFDGRDIGAMSRQELRTHYRRQVQPVFQNPFASLNPALSVAQNVSGPLLAHGIGNSSERRRKVIELLDHVKLPADYADRKPAELSGGQRQRVAIARALALTPQLVVCDEPLSALDVVIQDEIVRLLVELQRELSLSCLFVSHDLSVVRALADDVTVMHAGRIVEAGSAEQTFRTPRTHYTRTLLDAVPGKPFHKAEDRIMEGQDFGRTC